MLQIIDKKKGGKKCAKRNNQLKKVLENKIL